MGIILANAAVLEVSVQNPSAKKSRTLIDMPAELTRNSLRSPSGFTRKMAAIDAIVASSMTPAEPRPAQLLGTSAFWSLTDMW